MGVNAIPLGNHNISGVPEVTPQTAVGGNEEFADLTMGSLSNKNKRKGFKDAMGREVPPKIIFSEHGDQDTNTNGLRLVPPSEKQEEGLLPPNVFVTSVDVEEGLRPSKKPKTVVSKTKRLETPPVTRMTGEFDYTGIEAKWDSFGLVSSVSGLATGTVVGWKVSQLYLSLEYGRNGMEFTDSLGSRDQSRYDYTRDDPTHRHSCRLRRT